MHPYFDICELAIRQRMVLVFQYDGSLRHVEPHLLGLNLRSNLALRAWQLRGGSGIGWRPFLVDRMTDLRVSGEYFVGTRPDYNCHDKHMEHVYCCLELEDELLTP